MPRTHALTIALLVVICSAPIAAQDDYRLLRAGSDCGRVSIAFERLANGYRQCELREERRYTGVDNRSVTWRRTLTVLVDSVLRPVSVTGREFTPAGEFHISGSPADGALYLSRTDARGQVQSWREDGSGVPDLFLPVLVEETDLLLPSRVFFVRDLATRPSRVRLETGEGTPGRIIIDDGSVIELSDDGHIVSWGYPTLDLLAVDPDLPVAGVEPCDVDAGVFWDAGQVSFPTPAENVRAMDIRLTLTKEVGARLVPTDQRQSFAERQPSEGAQAVLRLTRIRARHGEGLLPVRDDELLPYLAESPMLNVTAESVRDRAATLRAVDRGMASISGEMQRWMDERFVEDDFIPLADAGVLALAPRGSRFHAAILLTALARAAGIPARLVLGLHPEGDRWRSTVWTELHTGAWVSVDPVTGDLIEDALHVKLLHAEDETELREQAQRLRGALRIDVLAVEELVPGEAGALRTGILGGVYTDRDYRCSFKAPEGWKIERRKKATETEITIWPETGSDVRCEILLSRYPYPIATREAFEAKVRALGVVLVDVEVTEKGEIGIGDRKAPYVVYSYRDTRPNATGNRITTADVLFTIMDRGYLIRFTTPSDSFKRHEGELQDILQNIRLYTR